MQRRIFALGMKLGFIAFAALGFGGCGHLGNFDRPEVSDSKPAKWFAFANQEAATAPSGPEDRKVFCPQIIILEGAAASQVHSGSPPSNENLRHQFSVTDVARECSLQGDQIAMKVGIAGNVLLGPTGAPGTFTVPLRVAIIRISDEKPVTSKLYHASATIASGQTQADFSVVSEPLLAPFLREHAEEDYIIKVGVDEGSPTDKPAGKRKQANAPQAGEEPAAQ